MPEPNGSAKKYENSLDWLIDAGMIQKVLNVSTPQLPLTGYEQNNQFKIYATDIGLATAMFGFQTQASLIRENLTVIPIEVKSKKGSTVSLNQFLKDWNPPYAYKLSAGNVGQAENKITIPHYMAMFV